MNAEGWYLDPFGLHQERWFSDGEPTILVRDRGVVSHDPPPSNTAPDGPLTPSPSANEEADAGPLLRADRSAADSDATQRVIDLVTELGPPGAY